MRAFKKSGKGQKEPTLPFTGNIQGALKKYLPKRVGSGRNADVLPG
jgi:hypothetical protein